MLVNAKNIITAAQQGHYAIGAFTIYNLEWALEIVRSAVQMKSPVILSVSEASAEYMGGYKIVSAMVNAIAAENDIPIVLHLDHGSLDAAFAAMDAGFTSVMYDGSRLPIDENIRSTAKLVAAAHKKNITVESEVGAIAGTEDGVTHATGEIADPDICHQIASTGIDMLAAGIGNIHGDYPKDWKGLDFNALAAIRAAVGNLPLVLHGGTGIPEEMIKQAISMGVAKINVNTECQQAVASGIRQYIIDGYDLLRKGSDPRKLFNQGRIRLYDTVCNKIQLFGSINQY